VWPTSGNGRRCDGAIVRKPRHTAWREWKEKASPTIAWRIALRRRPVVAVSQQCHVGSPMWRSHQSLFVTRADGSARTPQASVPRRAPRRDRKPCQNRPCSPITNHTCVVHPTPSQAVPQLIAPTLPHRPIPCEACLRNTSLSPPSSPSSPLIYVMTKGANGPFLRNAWPRVTGMHERWQR
jgi:hypothetical protein